MTRAATRHLIPSGVALMYGVLYDVVGPHSHRRVSACLAKIKFEDYENNLIINEKLLFGKDDPV